MSMTPVVTSVDGNVNDASHFSNLPSRGTDAFTEKSILLSSGVIWNTGAWARVNDGSMAETARQRTANLMGSLLNTKNMAILPPRWFHLCAPVTIVRNNKPADPKGSLSTA